LSGLDGIILGFILFTGSAVGSFLNVCIYRMPLEQSILWPSSFCPACRAPIRPSDNLPVVGYLRLRGKCRMCRTPISVRYPVVEAVTGLAALGSALWLGYTVEAAACFILFALLLPASLIDFEHQIIPNAITYPGMGIGIVLSFFRPSFGWQESLAGVGIGAGVLLAIRLLGTLLFRREAMGLGDVKLTALIGAFAGWQASVLSIFIGSIIGTLYSIPLLIQEARTGRKGDHLIPFGPFLAAGGLVAAVLRRTSWWPLWPL
jgi:leader peptidase (prepilin peptidase)/N-methyltransferase